MPIVKGYIKQGCFALPLVKGYIKQGCFALPLVKGLIKQGYFALPLVISLIKQGDFALLLVKGCIKQEKYNVLTYDPKGVEHKQHKPLLKIYNPFGVVKRIININYINYVHLLSNLYSNCICS